MALLAVAGAAAVSYRPQLSRADVALAAVGLVAWAAIAAVAPNQNGRHLDRGYVLAMALAVVAGVLAAAGALHGARRFPVRRANDPASA